MFNHNRRSMSIANQAKAAVCLGILTSVAVTAQTNSLASSAKATSSPVAYVYVQSSSGVVAYSAASNGQLTKISGSPFNTTGSITGSTGSIFFTTGTDDIHSYPVASNGAIKAQESEINTQKYSGATCGPAGAPGVLDHSGKYFYMFLDNSGSCGAYQTYTIGKNGVLTFKNWTDVPQESGGYMTAPTILGNEAFAYAISGFAHNANLIGFARESSGALQAIAFNETDPSGPSGISWTPTLVDGDPTNHLAVALDPYDSNPPQLASYTVDSHGDIVSTNTQEDMPTLPFAATELAFSPSGTLLAVAGGYPTGYGAGNGLEVFHFNGAKPITAYSGLLANMEIDGIKWDSSNHLYAISTKTNQLFVYTITATTITKAPGSPYTIADPTVLITKSL
jgi:hypothetical protein